MTNRFSAKPTSELHLLDCTYTPYSYDDNSDMLLSYGDETFAYDLIGNPTTYRGKTAIWEYGRQLKSYDGNTFSYDARGRRTAKNSITFTYDSNGNLIKQSNGLEFLYDHTGVFAVKYNGSTYFYRKNAQNDIIALLDNNGSVVVKYMYNAWGNCQTTVIDSTATEIAALNPFRYRSYYYDTETNLYFLKTRYYDPEMGRFITIDDISYLDAENINGLNLYAYCGNNPVMRYDPTGTWDWGVFWRVLVSTAAVAGGIALCFVPGAQAIGAGLIIAGAGGLIGGTIGYATGNGFNVGWDIGTLVGDLIGLAVAAPQLLSLTFNMSIPFLTPIMSAGTLGFAVSTVSVSVPVGGAIAATLGAGLLMFSWGANRYSPKDNRSNYVQNEEFQRICDEYGLNKTQRDRIHHRITKKGLNPDEIRKLIERLYPNARSLM